jgi:hypothetical protein
MGYCPYIETKVFVSQQISVGLRASLEGTKTILIIRVNIVIVDIDT